MNISHLVILLVRAFSICLAIYSINLFIYSMLLYVDNGAITKLSVAFPASILFAGVIVWFLPYSVAKLLTGNISNEKNNIEKISPDHLSNVVFLVLALYLTFQVVSDAGYWLYYYLNYESYGLNDIGIDAKASIFATALEAIVLVILILGRRKIFSIFKKLRS